VRHKTFPTLNRYNFYYFAVKIKFKKILQESVFTLQSRLVNFFTAVKYFMSNGTISLTSQIASLFANMAPFGRRPVFDKMFESGKRVPSK